MQDPAALGDRPGREHGGTLATSRGAVNPKGARQESGSRTRGGLAPGGAVLCTALGAVSADPPGGE